MHEVALATGPVAVILIGILFGVFYNQRAIDKLAERMNSNFAGVRHTLDIIQSDLKSFHRSLGQHDEAIVIIKKRLELSHLP
jgi:hypothetical protein